MMFPSESCNSVSKGSFRDFRPFSVIAEKSLALCSFDESSSSQCFFVLFILFNVCSSLQSLLCLFEINTVLQDKIQGNLGDFDAQNDVSV